MRKTFPFLATFLLAATLRAAEIPNSRLPRHLPHIRICELAYSGWAPDSVSTDLLLHVVDLLIPATRHLGTMESLAPNTPKLIYEDIVWLIPSQVIQWDNYADDHGFNREGAFYHVTAPESVKSAGPEAKDVRWFARTYVISGTSSQEKTSEAHNGTGFTVGSGASLYVGYFEKFREVNITLSAGAGFSGTWQYPSQVDASGSVLAWSPLPVISDTTNGLINDGGLAFDPPADWKTSAQKDGNRYFYLRLTPNVGNGASLAVKTILGRNYLNSGTTLTGTIPAFDDTADADHDGYLNDAEYPNRQTGMDARFTYESRLFFNKNTYGGPGLPFTNPGDAGFRSWMQSKLLLELSKNPLADGFFMDDSLGQAPQAKRPLKEITSTYAADLGAFYKQVWDAISPKWLICNTARSKSAGPILQQAPAGYEEFFLQPMDDDTSVFLTKARFVQDRMKLTTPAPLIVLDSDSTPVKTDNGRAKMAVLCYYYLLATNRTMLDFFGGEDPSSAWSQHWIEAAKVNVGEPLGTYSTFATGPDPANPAFTYTIFQRHYENALVLFKPESIRPNQSGTTADNTATTHNLNRRYRPVNLDGTLGPVVSSVTLRNSEGAILMLYPAASPTPAPSPTWTPVKKKLPSTIRSQAVSTTQVSLTWSNDSTDEMTIERRSSSDETFTPIAVVNATDGKYIDSGLNPSSQYVYRLRESDEEQDLVSQEVSAVTLGKQNTAAAIGDVTIRPNPWMSSKDQGAPITIQPLAAGAEAKIYTRRGDLVRSLTEENGAIEWDLTNRSGSVVASGIYIVVIDDKDGGKITKKIAIVK